MSTPDNQPKLPKAPHHKPDLEKLKKLARSIRADEDNQADWLDEIFWKLSVYPGEMGMSKAEAKAAITTKIAEERLDELKLAHNDDNLAGWTEARIAELEAALRGDG